MMIGSLDTSKMLNFSNSAITLTIYMLGGFMIAGIIAYALFHYFRNKVVYRYKVKLLKPRLGEAGYKKFTGLKGGLLKNKLGVMDFVIKIPKKFKKKWLGYVPDMSKATMDDELTFITSGDEMLWQQCTEELITEHIVKKEISNNEKQEIFNYYYAGLQQSVPDDQEREDEANRLLEEFIADNESTTYKLIMTPIPTDIKNTTINAIRDMETLMDRNKITAFGISVVAFIILAIVQIAFLVLTRNR